jgi:hypothetical protein
MNFPSFAARERLPNRRAHQSFPVEHNGLRLTVGVSRYADGRLAELVVNTDKVGTASAPQLFLQQLKCIALTRGYQPGWIVHQFKQKLGYWPKGFDYLPPIEPTGATLNWIKSRQIAFAKAQQRAAR